MASGTPVARLVALFGSRSAFAAALGVDRTITNKWDERYGGHVPPAYNADIMQVARARRISLRAVRECLSESRNCPTCGQKLKPGMKI